MFLNNYLRHPAYREYPVVGVSWEQAMTIVCGEQIELTKEY